MDFDELESRVTATIDSYVCKNETEHKKINRQLAELGGGGIMPNEHKINPEYYQGSAMADYVSDFELDFDLGNVIKYVSRAGKKFGEKAIDDLEKARWYLDHAINKITKNIMEDSKPVWEN